MRYMIRYISYIMLRREKKFRHTSNSIAIGSRISLSTWTCIFVWVQSIFTGCGVFTWRTYASFMQRKRIKLKIIKILKAINFSKKKHFQAIHIYSIAFRRVLPDGAAVTVNKKPLPGSITLYWLSKRTNIILVGPRFFLINLAPPEFPQILWTIYFCLFFSH